MGHWFAMYALPKYSDVVQRHSRGTGGAFRSLSVASAPRDTTWSMQRAQRAQRAQNPLAGRGLVDHPLCDGPQRHGGMEATELTAP